MSATMLQKGHQITLPDEVCVAAGVRESDQVDWRFEAGEIRGRKLAPQSKAPVMVHRAKLVLRDGQLVFDAPAVPAEAIAQAIREERDSE
jgi:hypothetical protein